MKKMLFLVNAHAGKTEVKAKAIDIIDIFIKGGYEVTVHTSQHPLEIPGYLARNGKIYDTIVCAGGDGTLNETVNGLMRIEEGLRPKLGYIPTGTVNDFASTAGISKNVLQAATDIIDGQPRRIDIATFNKRHFTYVAAFGAIAEVSFDTPQHYKNMFGKSAYILEGLKRVSKIRPYKMQIQWGDFVFGGEFILGMVTSSRSVGGIGVFENEKVDMRMDDGFYEVTLVTMPKTLTASADMLNALLKMDITDTNSIISFKAKDVSFHSETPVAWTVDGEFAGKVYSADVNVNKQAIQLITNPKGVSADDFTLPQRYPIL
ncbi:MAG: YegS/Rv2252/BmrU family lipid kinase [Eubacteriaceae bacterium]|nr:YegS/Rv2252/BmrU family lipid kinase [Eubacteriaceae bacterium]